MVVQPLTLRQRANLWAILTQREPEIASKIISLYIPTASPLETDLEKITGFLGLFCKLQNIHPLDCQGALYKSSKIEQRRIFIGVIAQMYGAETRLLPTYLSKALFYDQSHVIKTMKESKFRYGLYDDFKQAVDDLIQKMREAEHGAPNQ
jgi:hypothetical protein